MYYCLFWSHSKSDINTVIKYLWYNSQFEDTLKNTNFLPCPGFEPQDLFMWNKKIVNLRMTSPSIGCTVKGILFFLTLLHESIVYWASEIAAVHIVHTISSHDRVGISRLHIHALDVR